MLLPTPSVLETIPNGERGRRVRFAHRYIAVPSGQIWDTNKKAFMHQRNNGANQMVVTLQQDDGVWKKHYVSRIICDTLVMPLTTNIMVDHIDGRTTNNVEENLRPITVHNNNRRAVAQRRFVAKALSDDAVRAIRKEVKSGKTMLSLAGQYGVSRRTIQKAANGQTYKDVV